jgi:hypothetical protein
VSNIGQESTTIKKEQQWRKKVFSFLSNCSFSVIWVRRKLSLVRWSVEVLGWFQWWVACILLSIMLYQISLFLSTTSAPVTTYTSLQHSVHSHINFTYVSLLSPNQHHYSIFNNFRIYFMDNEFKKNNYIKIYNTIHKIND